MLCFETLYLFLFAFVIKAWQDMLRDITHNNKISNTCPRTNLMKQYVKFEFACGEIATEITELISPLVMAVG